jgi:hybrid cluster-associated redox disulfide protein
MIDKNVKISEVLKKYPKAVKVFDNFNMGCISCLGIQSETLEKGCLMHGIDVNEFIKELEKFINETYSSK